MDTEEIKKNKVGFILQFALPSSVAMILTCVLTVTDGFFTGNFVGEEALAAVNLGLPILYVYLATGLCIGVGGSVICGRLVGEKNLYKANRVFTQTMVLALAVCAVLSVIVYFLFEPVLHILKAEGNLAVYFRQYYFVMLFDFPLLVLSTVLSMFIRADGKPQVCMMVSILTCVLNILLDYIFMAKLDMGVQGSAIASLLVCIVSALLQVLYFVKSTERDGIKFAFFKFDKDVNKETLLNGSSEFIGEAASAVSMFAFNFVLMKYIGSEGVAAFTILGFSVYAFSMIVLGFGQGLMPLVSICAGAKEFKTAVQLRQITDRILFALGLVFALVLFLFGLQYAKVFGAGGHVALMVAGGLRIFAVTFVVTGYNVIASMIFTSLGKAKESALVSALRGIVLLLAFTFVFPYFWGMNGIWLVTPATEVLTFAVSIALIRKFSRSAL